MLYKCVPIIMVIIGLGVSNLAIILASIIKTKVSDYITISITNIYSKPLSLSLDLDASSLLLVRNLLVDIILSILPTRFTFPIG